MGYRIELGEIEQAAKKVETINECCCLYDAEKKIVLFFGDAETECLTEKEEKSFLNICIQNGILG
ncbi:MAG: hypothetical protein NC331_00565 [Lachnospiraceae bacterium]|nr:hypothetical protein [Lachnospiraceae bacterium]MCM1237860.1 hypothetical protein [Lachnospiraceae bacterium]